MIEGLVLDDCAGSLLFTAAMFLSGDLAMLTIRDERFNYGTTACVFALV
jgi:hypothetical protein